jgi:4-diphosphocytidyl-2-C-methyl-D-erythritol kinase
MLESGALGTMMSGSGPSVFGVFDDPEKAEAARSAIEATGLKAFVCKPVSR